VALRKNKSIIDSTVALILKRLFVCLFVFVFIIYYFLEKRDIFHTWLVVFGQIPHLALLDVLLPTVSPVHICWLLIEEILAFLLLEEHLAPSIVPLALPWPFV
jgi:hypothetical protein